jgi:hypothetical protein
VLSDPANPFKGYAFFGGGAWSVPSVPASALGARFYLTTGERLLFDIHMFSLISISLYRALRPLAMFCLALVLIPFVGHAGEQLDAKANPSPPPVKKKEVNPLSFWDGRLVIDIEERMRLEIRENNRDFDAGSDHQEITDDAWLLNRFRFGLTFAPNSWVKLYGQTQDSREAFSERPNVPGLNGADGTDQWDLRQAYIAIGDLKKFPVQVTVGRQSFYYGDGRLLADSRWGNFGRTFDAVKLRLEEPHFWLEGFFLRPVQIERGQFNESDSADNFGGAYFSTDWLSFQTSDLYVFYRDKKDNQPDLSPTNTIDPQGTWNGPAARFVTIGARFKSNPKKLGPWDYSGEFVYENGDVWQTDAIPSDLIGAFALAVSVAGTFKDCLWTPRSKNMTLRLEMMIPPTVAPTHSKTSFHRAMISTV